jgi:DNA-binding beta-propeller fold protein YncE
VPAFAGTGLPDEYVVFDVVGETVLEGPTSLLPEANYPYDATIRPDGAEVWFVGASGDGFVVVDPSSYDILHQATLTAGQYAVDVLFSADSTLAYIAKRDTDDVTVLDTSDYSEIEDIATPGGLQAGKMALNPCTGHIYVVEWYGDELMTYDPEADSWDSVDIGVASLWDLVVDSGGSTLYVTDRGNDEVHIFDVAATGVPGDSPDDSITVGDDPWGIDITSDGNTVVVACEDDYTVHFIDVATLGTTSLDLPQSEPRDVDISADDSLAYIPTGDSDEDGMFVVDIASETLLTTIPLGSSDTNVVAVTPQAATCVE